MSIDWVYVSEELPVDNAPVLLKIGSTIQHIIYILDTGDLDDQLCFTPNYFDPDENSTIPVNFVKCWIYVENIETD